MDIRLNSPQAILGDPMVISYYVNNNINPSTYINYKLSNNTASELKFIPEQHDTLYYFSTLKKNSGTSINILPENPIPYSRDSYAVVMKIFNPASSGMYQFNALAQAPGDVPMAGYLGSWNIDIE